MIVDTPEHGFIEAQVYLRENEVRMTRLPSVLSNGPDAISMERALKNILERLENYFEFIDDEDHSEIDRNAAAIDDTKTMLSAVNRDVSRNDLAAEWDEMVRRVTNNGGVMPGNLNEYNPFLAVAPVAKELPAEYLAANGHMMVTVEWKENGDRVQWNARHSENCRCNVVEDF